VILQQFGRSQMLARTPLETLHQRQIGWKAEQAASLQAWLRSNGEPDAIVAGEWPTFPSPTTHPNERTAA
jgi:DNA polymerase-3 subunit epsilon